MRRWLGRETPPPAPSLRDTLFGDLPLAQWGPAGHGEGEPWTSFATAREAEARGDTARAVAALQAIVAMPALESRHYLEAWHALRRHGAPPPADRAAALLGVVVEVALPEGLDLLAAYADRTARYYNYAGPGIVWERPDASLDPWIDAVLAAARAIAGQIGP